MRTEAKPLLGRSVSAYSNERYCDRRLGKPGLHVLPALAPGMVLLRPPHDPDSGGWRNWQRDFPYRLLEFGKADSLPAVVHLHSPVTPFREASNVAHPNAAAKSSWSWCLSLPLCTAAKEQMAPARVLH